MEDVFEYTEHHALPYESEDPYVAKDSTCRSGSVNDYVAILWCHNERRRPKQLKNISHGRANYGPVAVVLITPDAFQHYRVEPSQPLL